MSEKVLGVVGKRERDDLLGLELGASQNLYKFRQFSYKSNCSERAVLFVYVKKPVPVLVGAVSTAYT